MLNRLTYFRQLAVAIFILAFTAPSMSGCSLNLNVPEGGVKISPPSAIEVGSVKSQSSVAGKALFNTLKVVVKNEFGETMPNVLVQWTIVAGGGSIESKYTITGKNGYSSNIFTPGQIAGTNTVIASIPDTEYSVTFTVQGVAGPVTQLTFDTSPQNAIAGNNFTPSGGLKVSARDEFGNINTTTLQQISVTLDPNSNPVSGVLVGSAVAIANPSAGIATFPNLSVNTAYGSYRLKASQGSITAISDTFTIDPATLQKFTFDQGPASGSFVAGTNIATTQIWVSARDQFDNVLSSGVNRYHNKAIQLAINPPTSGATISTAPFPPLPASGATSITSTATNGVAIFSSVAINKVGTFNLRASSDTGASASPSAATFTITPAAVHASQSSITVSASSINSASTSLITLFARDAFGNMVPGLSSTSFSNSSGTGVSTGTYDADYTALSGANAGQYTQTFRGALIGTATTINATVSGTSNFVTSTLPTITVSGPGPISSTVSTVTISPSTITAGASSTITVTVKDAAGNPISGISPGNFAFAYFASGTSTVSPAPASFSVTEQGSGVYTATFTGAGSGTAKQIQTTVSGTVVLNDKPSITVNPAPPDHFVFASQPPASTAAGSILSQNVVVRCEDAFNNTLVAPSPAIAITISPTTNFPTLTIGSTSSSNGVYTFSNLSVDKVGTYTLVASGCGGITSGNTSNSFSITGAAFTQTLDANSGNFSASDSNVIDFSNGLEISDGIAKLTSNLTDNSAAKFSLGTHTGTRYDSENQYLQTFTLTNEAELDSTWTPQWTNLISYWKLNNNGNDSRGSNNGTAQGNATYVANARLGSHAATLDGSGDYFTVADNASLKPTNQITMSGWIKVNSSSGNFWLFSKNVFGPQTGYGIAFEHASSAKIWPHLAINSALVNPTSSGKVTYGQWNYVAVTYDGTQIKIYLDGQLDSTTAASGAITQGTAALTLGSLGTSEYLNGQIDDVAIWSTALSDTEIRTIYDRQSAKYSGTFTSRVMDAGSSIPWRGFSWIPTLPFFKPLPAGNGASIELSSDYTSLVSGPTTEGLLNQGLVSLWHLDEASGTSFADSVAGFTGSAVGGTINTVGTLGKSGRGITTAYDTGYISVPYNSVQNSFPFTASVWFKMNGAFTGNPALIGNYVAGSNNGWSIYFNNNSGNPSLCAWYMKDSTNKIHNTNCTMPVPVGTPNFYSTDNTWHQATLTVDSSGGTLYVDGVSKATQTWTGTPGAPTTTSPVLIGRYDHTFNGSIDEPAIWNRALSATEVAQLYNQRRIEFNPGLVGVWHLDEASGTTGTSTIVDASGNGNHGTPFNGPVFGKNGKLGYAASFYGSDEYIDIPTTPTTEVNSGTVSAWINTTDAGIGSRWIVVKKSAYAILASNNVFALYDYGAGAIRATNVTLNDGKWHQVAATFRSGVTSGTALFVDGNEVSVGSPTTMTVANQNSSLLIGSEFGQDFNGLIDEVAIWNRPLSATEVKQVYRRGANRVKYQVRSCAASTCNDTTEPWKGPDNSNQTYFSELNNNSDVYGTGSVLPTLPNLLFSSFSAIPTLSVPNNRYFQYRAILETDTNGSYPEVKSVTAGVSLSTLPVTVPSITSSVAVQMNSLSALSVILGADGCKGTPGFLLSNNGSTWYRWNGASWSTITPSYSDSNTEAVVNQNIAAFGSMFGSSGTFTLYVKIFLPSNGISSCDLTGVSISGTSNASSPPSGTPASIVWAPAPESTATVGNAMTAFKVRILDSNGYVVNSSANVTLTPSTLSGTLTQAASNGVATFSGISYSNPGTITITATLAGVPAISKVVTVGSAASFSETIHFNLTSKPVTSSDSNNVGFNLSTSQLSSSLIDDSAEKFDAGTGVGTLYDRSKEVLRLAMPSAMKELDSSWAPQWESMVGYWNMNNSFSNMKGSVASTTFGSSPTFTPLARLGSHAGSFTTTSQWIDIRRPLGVNSPGSKTYAGWIYPQCYNCYLISNYHTGSNGFSVLLNSNGTIGISWTGIAGVVSTSGTIPHSAWTHVAATFNSSGNIGKIYINGEEAPLSTSNSLGSEIGQTNNIRLGGRWTSANAGSTADFIGMMDEVGLWKSVLTSTEIQTIYNQQSAKYVTNNSELDSSWTPKYSSISGYWKLNGSGSVANGATVTAAVGPNGTASGGGSMAYQTGKLNQGILFNPANSNYISVASTTTINATNNFSISFWIKPNNFGSSILYYPISKGDPDAVGNGGWALGYVGTGSACSNLSGQTYLYSNGIISGCTSQRLNLGVWNHVTLTYDSSTVSIYLNGVLSGSTSSVAVRFDPAATFQIGRRADDGYYVDGAMDEIAFWNATLSASDVQTIYSRQAAAVSGVFTSRVMHGGANQRWTHLSWLPTLPFFKNSPDDGFTQTTVTYNNTTSQLGLWRMNETSGTTVADSVGSNSLTVTGTTAGAAGRFGRGLRFSSTSGQYASLGSAPAIGSTASATYTIWVNPDAIPTSQQYIIDRTTATFDLFGLYFTGTDSKYRLQLRSNTMALTDVAGGTIRPGVWQHIAMVRDTAALKFRLYVDGSEAATGSDDGLTLNFPTPRLGNHSSGSIGFLGAVDEFSTWSRALSATEIKNLYLQGAVPSEVSTDYSSLTTDTLMSGNVGLWHFDESSWTGAANEVKDSSGNANHGTTGGSPNTVSAGILGRAGSFNGTTQKVQVADSPSLKINASQSITLSAWVKPPNIGAFYPIIAKRLASGAFTQYSMNISGNNSFNGSGGKQLNLIAIESSAGNYRGAYANVDFVDGNWHHVAGIIDGTLQQLRLYIDGKQVPTTLDQTGGSWPNTTNTQPLTIGHDNGTAYYTGLIDEVGVWTRALSASEILQLYRRGANRVKFQVRSCAASTCNDATEPWRGPDNSNLTYFSELNNNSNVYGTGSTLRNLPSMLFSAFNSAPSLVIPGNGYFQYRAILESDDDSGNCTYGSAMGCSPEIRKVSAVPVYDKTLVDYTEGSVQQTLDLTDDSLSEFLSGIANSTTYDPTYFLRLNATTNTSDLDSTWVPPYSSLVGYWKLNSNANATVGGVDGVAGGSGLSYATGKVNQAATLGGSAYITVGNSSTSTFDFASNTDFSVSAWAKWTGTPMGRIFSTGHSGFTNGYMLATVNGKVRFGIGAGGIQANATHTDSVNTFNDGAWHNLVTTYSRSGSTKLQSLYVDGVNVAIAKVVPASECGTVTGNNLDITACTSIDATRSVTPMIGAYNTTTERFVGSIDDVAVWSKALSATEIKNIYDRQYAKYSGTFTSRVMDGLTERNWTGLSWIPTLPFYKPLPDLGASYSESSSAYSGLSTSSLMSGLTGLYHFNENSWSGAANEVVDSSGNGNHGVRGGSANTAVTGMFGRSGVFNGTDDFVTFSGSSPVPVAQGGTVTTTVSVWFKVDNMSSRRSLIFFGPTGLCNPRPFYFYIEGGNMIASAGGCSGTGFAVSSIPISTGVWTHGVVVNNSSGLTSVYLNGILVASNDIRGGISFENSNVRIGGAWASSFPNYYFDGQIDEVAVWNRALSGPEVLQLYRRGANRVKYQVRTCASSICNDTSEPWKGPDNTNGSYFSEINNNDTIYGFGNTLATLPNMLFGNFAASPALSLAPNRYFQYRTILESDDPNASSCNYGSNTWCSPEVKSISASVSEVNSYSTSSESVTTSAPTVMTSLSSLTSILGGDGCTGTARFLLSANGSTYYGWNGFTWQSMGSGSYSQANNEAEINQNISTFASTLGLSGNFQIYIRAYLRSDGVNQCQLTGVTLSGGSFQSDISGTQTSLSWDPAPAEVVSQGVAIPTFKVRILDQNGFVTTYENSKTVTLSVISGGGVLNGTVAAVASSGVATFSNLTYNSTGTVTVRATLSGTPSLTLDRTFKVVPQGVYSLAKSLLTTPASALVGNTVTLTLTAYDNNGNPNPTGINSVSFSRVSGPGTATFGSVTHQGFGVYTIPFSNSAAGTVTLQASINGQPVTLAPIPANMTIATSAPTLTGLPANRLMPLGSGNPLTQGSTFSFTVNSSGTGTTSVSCTYETVGLSAVDPNYAPPGSSEPCSSLSTLGTTNSVTLVKTGAATGVWPSPNPSGSGSIPGTTFSWTPTNSQRGTYRFIFTSTDSTGLSTTSSVYVSVIESFSLSNIVAHYDPLFGDYGVSSPLTSVPAIPRIPLNGNESTSGTFSSLVSSHTANFARFGSSAPFNGTGRSSASAIDPYALNFVSSSSDSFVPSLTGSPSNISVNTWIKPSSPTTPGSVISSNGTTNAFTLRQSLAPAGKAEFIVGAPRYYNYSDLILSDQPLGYWKLNETPVSGSTVFDYSARQNNGTLSGSYTRLVAGPGTISLDGATTFTSGATVPLGDLAYADFGTSNFTLELWFKTTNTNNTYLITKRNVGVFGNFWELYINSGKIIFDMAENSGPINYQAATTAQSYNDGNWHLIQAIRSGTSVSIYVDGTIASSQIYTSAGVTNLSNNATLRISGYEPFGSPDYFFIGTLDDVAIYGRALTPTEITNHYQTGINGNYKPYPGNAILADNPVGYWRLGEKSGRVAYDYSGNGLNGDYVGTPTQGVASNLSGDEDTATQFSGTGQYINVPHSSLMNATSAWSAEAWIRRSATGVQHSILEKYDFTVGTAGLFGLRVGSNDRFNAFVSVGQSGTGCFSTTIINSNTWYHVAATFNAADQKVRCYVNGSLQGSPVTVSTLPTASSLYPMRIGARGNDAGTPFNGVLDEVAFFDYTLSDTQIMNHRNNTAWWLCQSRSSLSSSAWSLLSALYNGTTAELMINGTSECSLSPGLGAFNFTLSNTKYGSDTSGSNFWSGAMALFDVFNTSLSPSAVRSFFSAIANRFRSYPVENIVTNNLLLNLDPANANSGVAPFANGCANTNQTWFDLSTNGFLPTLFNFSSCGASSGWVGDGTVSNPYALALDGSSDYVEIPDAASLQLTSNFTLMAWINPTTLGGRVIDKGFAGGIVGYNMDTHSSKLRFCANNCISTVASLTTSNWQHIAVTFANSGSNGLVFYINGTNSGTGTLGVNPSSVPLRLGADSNASSLFNGKFGPMKIYSIVLTPQQVKQNCLAEERRFTSVPQSICGAP